MRLNIFGSLSSQQFDTGLSHKRWTNALLATLLILVGMGIIVVGSWVIGSTNMGMWVIVGLVGLALPVAIINHPAIGLYVLVVFVYMNLSDIIEVNFGIPSLNKLLVLLTAVSVLGKRVILQDKPLVFGRTEFMVALYVFVITLSTFTGTASEDFFSQVIDVVKDFIILLIIVQVSDNENSWKKMQWYLILAAAFLASLTTYQMLTGNFQNDFLGLAKAPVHQIVGSFDSTRPTGPLEDPNYYAQILLMVMPLAIYRVIGEKKPLPRLVAISSMLLIAVSIIFTYSRTALVVLLLVGFLIAYERRFNLYKLAAIIISSFVLVSPILPPGYLDRMSTLLQITSSSTMQTERSFRGRSSEMIIAVQMFWDRPILGVGYGNYQSNYLEYSKWLGIDDRLESREAHSLYLEAAAETGIFGLLAFMAMLSTILLMLHRAQSQLRRINRADVIPWVTGLQYGLMAYLATSIFLHDDYVRYLRLSIALAAGGIALVESLIQKHDAERREGEF